MPVFFWATGNEIDLIVNAVDNAISANT